MLDRAGQLTRLGQSANWLNKTRHPYGGWGLTPSQEVSIVNTAEALHVLRVAGFPYSEPAVRDGVAWIAAHAQEITQPNENPGGRGLKTRYPVFAIRGICEYSAAILEPGPLRTVEWGVEWLDSHKTSRGWPESPDGRLGATEASPMQTANTVLALAQLLRALRDLPSITLEGNTRLESAAVNLLAGGVDALLRFRGSDGFWPSGGSRNNRRSYSNTGLAITALLDAAEFGRRALDAQSLETSTASARQSAHALQRTSPKWERLSESDDRVPGSLWETPAFSVCLAACHRAGYAAEDPHLTRAWAHLDRTWDRPSQSWRDRADQPATVRASFHAARAVFSAHVGFASHTPVAGNVQPTSYEVDEFALVANVAGSAVTIPLPPRLLALAQLLVERPGGADASEIAHHLRLSSSSVSKYVTRLRNAIDEAAAQHGIAAPLLDSRSKRYYLPRTPSPTA